MRRNIDNIEIVEPPLEELTRKHSYKRTCFTGCGCIVFFIIAGIVALRFYVGPGPTTLKTIPSQFPADIIVYDPDNIQSITFISGKYKNRGIEIAALFPKIILSPLLLTMNKDTGETANSTINKESSLVKNLWKVISAPVGDHRDTIQIEWQNIDAEPSFVVGYYKKELAKKNFTIDVESEGQAVRQFSFSRVDGISGSFYAEGDETIAPGTPYAILTVNLPDKE
ncbi:MAG: hypothetical protein US58_C0022G0025 [Candidatus Magasanikbacteria bacterium GW2011_GWA2_37_8]|uniref:Uncharacterized protein n=1 Tax=Candidatus Magasanikbacteria bacterium GW2011_GWA2_37_8 TaxID=1619036 RepID=A0A0G0KI82_9BACT|nr:MAG: hypothetical protein US58_C0022G0025 [Candidatus Magasanikbacteria bacterium GW2011_GWA2_37_8]